MQEGNLKDLGPIPEARLQPQILQKRLMDAGLVESFIGSSITSESSKKETHTILSAVEDDKDESTAMAFMRLSSPERRRYQRFRTVDDGQDKAEQLKKSLAEEKKRLSLMEKKSLFSKYQNDGNSKDL